MAAQRKPQAKTMAGSNITRIPDTKIESEWTYVTAAQMAKWLKTGEDPGVNRNLNELHVRRLMHDMENDRWSHTHQGLAFDVDGKLRDGQHRGTAQVRLGQDRWWLITRGLPSAAQHNMDAGRKRGIADFTGGRNRNIRASAARTIRAFELTQPNITESRIREVMRYMTTADVIESMDEQMLAKLDALSSDAYHAGQRTPAFSASSLLAAAGFVLTEEEGREWLTGFAEMSNLRTGDPRIALMKIRGSAGKRLNQQNERILALRCAVAWKNDEEVKVLKPSLVHSVRAIMVGTEPIEAQ